MSRPPTARRRALEFLHDLVSRMSVGEPLPPVRRLAANAGVSVPVMVRAVREFRDNGVVDTFPGRGTVAGSASATMGADSADHGQVSAPQPVSRWQAVSMSIRREILNGIWPPGKVLPSAKELMGRYGVCYRTLRKSLSRLVHERYLQSQHKQYRVPPLRRTGPRNTVLLLLRGRFTEGLHLLPPRTLTMYRELESACAVSGLNLEVGLFSQEGSELRADQTAQRVLSGGRDLSSVLGFIVWTAALDSLDMPALVHRLGRLRRPASVLDEGSFDGELEAMCRVPRSCVFTMSCRSPCGESAGRYLLRLGHRQIAYIDTAPHPAWSANRLHGLRTAFAKAGLPRGVHSFAVSSSGDRQRIVDSLSMMPSERLPAKVRSALETTLQRYRTLVVDSMMGELVREQLEAGLSKPLTRPDLTAWVCANDALALRCLSVLRQRGNAVPRRVSVMGFDDSLEASYEKLTSYNFNYSALTQAMLGNLTGSPAIRALRTRRKPIEIDGFVTERSSTAPVF